MYPFVAASLKPLPLPLVFGIAKAPLRQSHAVQARPARAAVSGWIRRDEAIMGTAISVDLWAEEQGAGEAAAAAVMSEMHRIDRAMSPHRADSELSRINSDAGDGAVPISDEVTRLLVRAQAFARLSDGAFDITYAAVGHLYDYRQRVRPSEAALQSARAAIGWQHLVLDAQARTVRFARPGMRIDLGGFAKGHAVDKATAILQQRGIRHAMVSAGGDSRVVGDRRGRPWMVGVRDPRQAGAVVAMLPLQDVSISTSGDYERYFDAEGVRFHHVIDPRTGRSPSSVRSVTILAEDGLTTEAMSKIVFVLGLERGMRLVAATPGVDAVVVDAAGALHFSSGLLAPINAPQQHGQAVSVQ